MRKIAFLFTAIIMALIVATPAALAQTTGNLEDLTDAERQALTDYCEANDLTEATGSDGLVYPCPEAEEAEITFGDDAYESEEQEQIGENIVGELFGQGGGVEALSTEAPTAFDPTRWGGCFVKGAQFPEGDTHERERGETLFRPAEFQYDLEDTDNDMIFELIERNDVYGPHALLFDNFSGVGVDPCMLNFPNSMRMVVVENEDGELPELVSFTVQRDEFAYNALGDGPWNDLSEGTGIVTLQIGSWLGADVVIQVDGEAYGYRIVGGYCDLCVADTAIDGVIAQYDFERDDFAFEAGADVTTEDVLTIEMPDDFSQVTITIFNIQGQLPDQPAVSVWFGSGNPETVSALGQGGGSATTATILAERLNVRETPVNGEVIGAVTRNQAFDIQAVDPETGWYQIEVSDLGTSGWITNDELYVESN